VKTQILSPVTSTWVSLELIIANLLGFQCNLGKEKYCCQGVSQRQPDRDLAGSDFHVSSDNVSIQTEGPLSSDWNKVFPD